MWVNGAGFLKYGSRSWQLQEVILLTWMLTLHLATLAMMYLGDQERPPKQSRRELLEAILAKASAEPRFEAFQAELAQAKEVYKGHCEELARR
jgi:hypothetical protein